MPAPSASQTSNGAPKNARSRQQAPASERAASAAIPGPQAKRRPPPTPSNSARALQRAAGNRAVHALLQDGAESGDGGVPALVPAVLREAGRPLDPVTRAEMEARFREDFSEVRMHEGPTAAASAQAMEAVAYTVGRDVVFDAGRYAPATAPGRHLLGHELAHVVQQRRGGPGPLERRPDFRMEQSADAAASLLAGGRGPVTVAGSSPVGIACATEEQMKGSAPGATEELSLIDEILGNTKTPGEQAVDEAAQKFDAYQKARGNVDDILRDPAVQKRLRRILHRKGKEADVLAALRGELMEEVMNREIRARLKYGVGLDTLLPKGVSPEGLEFIEGDRIRGARNEKLSDGLLVRRLDDGTLEVVAVFEAKAGEASAQGLHQKSGTVKDPAEMKRPNRISLEKWAELQRVQAETSGRVKSTELGGQIRSTNERLREFPEIRIRHVDAETGAIKKTFDVVRVKVTKDTRFIGAAPKDVSLGAQRQALAKEAGIKFEAWNLDVDSRQLQGGAQQARMAAAIHASKQPKPPSQSGAPPAAAAGAAEGGAAPATKPAPRPRRPKGKAPSPDAAAAGTPPQQGKDRPKGKQKQKAPKPASPAPADPTVDVTTDAAAKPKVKVDADDVAPHAPKVHTDPEIHTKGQVHVKAPAGPAARPRTGGLGRAAAHAGGEMALDLLSGYVWSQVSEMEVEKDVEKMQPRIAARVQEMFPQAAQAALRGDNAWAVVTISITHFTTDAVSPQGTIDEKTTRIPLVFLEDVRFSSQSESGSSMTSKQVDAGAFSAYTVADTEHRTFSIPIEISPADLKLYKESLASPEGLEMVRQELEGGLGWRQEATLRREYESLQDDYAKRRLAQIDEEMASLTDPELVGPPDAARIEELQGERKGLLKGIQHRKEVRQERARKAAEAEKKRKATALDEEEAKVAAMKDAPPTAYDETLAPPGAAKEKLGAPPPSGLAIFGLDPGAGMGSASAPQGVARFVDAREAQQARLIATASELKARGPGSKGYGKKYKKFVADRDQWSGLLALAIPLLKNEGGRFDAQLQRLLALEHWRKETAGEEALYQVHAP